MAAIELRGVTKQYGEVTAVDELDLTVESGEIYGFLGPNGAGKSTTINVLLDLITPTAGDASVLGYDIHEEPTAIRERIGVVPEGYDIYNRLSGRKHIQFAIDSKGAADDPDELLSRVGLDDAGDRPAGGYSKGMTQRLALGIALVGSPELLILDEPTTGLDPNGAQEMREIIRAENERGATVFFSSHILEQVEAVCDRVGIMREGELVAQDTIGGLRDQLGTQTTLVFQLSDVPAGLEATVSDIGGVESVAIDGTQITVKATDDAKGDVLSTIQEHASVEDFSTEEQSLEELFVEYTSEAPQTA
ncbi:ABC transporter ATP-binding protein [Halocatena pleomorpha]|uniref:ABC transporter ATP-binding protein n=1 Tax=Halocatena pleomorpha TaxID=1785090 RepID=A0A3P3RG04_9EURY|nr:ABC transporter ATP-binding protein [Halocatena pleomorpha]RRJ31848.1 ABC transporter ATP-binding protein [Halocatena pleomorpha]